MSQSEQVPPGEMYGVKKYDLGTAREYPGQLEQFPNARVISTGSVPDECYIRLGSETAPKLDLRNFETIQLPRGKSFGQAYIQNPAGSGTLELIIGIEVEPEREIVVDTIESITGTVDVDIVAQALDRLESELELEDAAASGTFANVHRRGDALQASLENDQVGLALDATLTNVLDRNVAQVDAADVVELLNEPSAGDRRYKVDLEANNAGTLPTEQQTPVALEDDGGSDISTTNPLSIDAPNTLPTEQQTPVQVEDAGGTNIDPRQQGTYTVEYTDMDLNSTGTTTIYAPTNDAVVSGVHMANGGGTNEVRLEVTDGTNTATLAGAAISAGDPIHFEDEVHLAGGVDELQITVSTTEGSALTETAAVPRSEL